MTITLPSGVRLSLHQDLAAGFPDSLQHITNPELRHLLDEHDPTPDSPIDSGALDWADLPDRLHFIIDLFRCYQENHESVSAPVHARAGRGAQSRPAAPRQVMIRLGGEAGMPTKVSRT